MDSSIVRLMREALACASCAEIIGAARWQPLSDAAFEVLERARPLDDGSGLIFPSKYKPGSPLSNVAFMNLLKRIGYADRTTAHGFRATFRTWATECTDAKVRAKKLSTAHKVGDDIEEAYDRAIVLDSRRELMQRWACYVMGKPYSPPVPPLLGPLPQTMAIEQLGLFDLP